MLLAGAPDEHERREGTIKMPVPESTMLLINFLLPGDLLFLLSIFIIFIVNTEIILL